jgi:hypothetical protein
MVWCFALATGSFGTAASDAGIELWPTSGRIGRVAVAPPGDSAWKPCNTAGGGACFKDNMSSVAHHIHVVLQLTKLYFIFICEAMLYSMIYF